MWPVDRPLVSQDMLYVVMVVTYVPGEDSLYNIPCSGTLLRPNMVLTSEFCVMNDPHHFPEPETILIHDRLRQKLRAHMIYVRPRKVIDKPEFNLALIICDKTNILMFPKLPTEPLEIPEMECKIGGFGMRTKHPALDNFKVNQMDKSMFELCSMDNRSKQICLFLKTVMPCVGDVGSPLVCGGLLQGLYTPLHFPFYNNECVDRTETLFTPIYPAVDWITKVQDSLETSYPKWLFRPWAILLLSFFLLLITACIYKVVLRLVENRVSLILRQDSGTLYRHGFKNSTVRQSPTPWDSNGTII